MPRCIALAAAAFALAASLGSCASLVPARPAFEAKLSDYGIEYKLVLRNQPRPLRIHIALADLTSGKFRISMPVPLPASASREGDAGLVPAVREAESLGSLLLVNASAFAVLGYAKGARPLFYEPGMRVDIAGLAIHEGRLLSLHRDGTAALRLDEAGGLSAGYGPAPDGCVEAAAGFGMLIDEGRIAAARGDSLAARTAIGESLSGTLIFVVVEGGLRGRSEGMSFGELASLMLELGANWALNMDGGGSSQMVLKIGGKEIKVSVGEDRFLGVDLPLPPLPNFVALLPR